MYPPLSCQHGLCRRNAKGTVFNASVNILQYQDAILTPHGQALIDDPLFMEEIFEKTIDDDADYYDDYVLDDFMADYFN